MDSNLLKKVERLNELYNRQETTKDLTESELKEQGIYREEIMNYYKYAILKHTEK